MKRTIIRTLLSATLLLFLLNGCGKTDSGEVYKPNVPAAEEAAEQAAQSAVPSPAYEENYDAEEIIADLFKGDEMSGEETTKLFDALPDINWSEYERYTDGKAMELISWLYQRGSTERVELISIVNATDGLDGAFTEGYAAILDNAFIAEPEKFVKCLAQIDAAKAERADAYIAFDCAYGAREEVKEAIALTKELISGDKLSAAEKQAAEQLLRTIEAGASV
jgi:hypothetical protein